MKYIRLYADSNGETHFEDLDFEFTEGKVWSGSPRLGRSETQPTSDSFFVEIYEDFSGGFHPTPRKQWFVAMSGTVEFGASDGEVRKLEPGVAVLLDDMGSKGHFTSAEKGFVSMFVGLE